MANKVFVTCELNRPEKGYDRVVAAVKSIGDPWIPVHFTLWYLSTSLSAAQVCDRIKPALDKSDQLFVIDATNNEIASVNLRADVSKSLYDQGIPTTSRTNQR